MTDITFVDILSRKNNNGELLSSAHRKIIEKQLFIARISQIST